MSRLGVLPALKLHQLPSNLFKTRHWLKTSPPCKRVIQKPLTETFVLAAYNYQTVKTNWRKEGGDTNSLKEHSWRTTPARVLM